jgi:hypothetical protein
VLEPRDRTRRATARGRPVGDGGDSLYLRGDGGGSWSPASTRNPEHDAASDPDALRPRSATRRRRARAPAAAALARPRIALRVRGGWAGSTRSLRTASRCSARRRRWPAFTHLAGSAATGSSSRAASPGRRRPDRRRRLAAPARPGALRARADLIARAFELVGERIEVAGRHAVDPHPEVPLCRLGDRIGEDEGPVRLDPLQAVPARRAAVDRDRLVLAQPRRQIERDPAAGDEQRVAARAP